eukprot:gb/GECG01009981.1/.p1 GENE.gb/GECG01009981.1/~~gb/GECG01009981.1/.p1  ORF type:complete len:1716 (+),score=163.17 gb/GECG01009981.1/:1-5148(+)
MNTICCWDGGTDCCLFVRCRPVAWKRLTRNIFPPRGKGITGKENHLMPQKLSKLLRYASDREDSLPDIGRELQRRARRALRSKEYGYVQVAMFAYKRLIMLSAGGLGSDSLNADDFVPTVDQNRKAPRRVHRTVDATHFSVFEIFVVQVIHDLLRHPHPWMRYLGADTLHALLACKESHSDAEKLVHSLLDNLRQDLAEAKRKNPQYGSGSSRFKRLWAECNCKGSSESPAQEEYEWTLKARYASFCALYTSILKADSGMSQVHIQHTIPSILQIIEDTWKEYNTQLRQLVHELKKGRTANPETMFLRREATLLPLASLALSLLSGNTESARFDVLMREVLDQLDREKWADLSCALHICRLTDTYNWHAYKMNSLALLEFPKNYNRSNLYQFWSQYEMFLHGQGAQGDTDDEGHMFNGVELTLEDLQMSLNSHSPCTQQVRQIARETNRNEREARATSTATLEKWPHTTAWDGVLGINTASFNRLLRSAVSSKRPTDWRDELSRPFRHQLGKIIPPVADKTESSKPGKSKWQRSSTGSPSLRYGIPVFVHLLRHLTHVNDKWEVNVGQDNACEPTDPGAFERQLHSSITVETSNPRKDRPVTSIRASATAQDMSDAETFPRRNTISQQISRKVSSRETPLASSSAVEEEKGHGIPKQRQVGNLLRRGSTWVSGINDKESRDSLEASTDENARITETGEPKAWTWTHDNDDVSHSSFAPKIENTSKGANATRWRINTLEIVTRLVVESFALCEDDGASQLSESWFQESMEHLMPHLLELPADVVIVGNNSEITDNNSGSVPDTAFICFLAFLMRCHQSSQISNVIQSISAWSADVQNEILVPPADTSPSTSFGVCDSGSLLSPSPIFDCARLRILDALLVASRLRMCKVFAEQLESGGSLDSKKVDKWVKQVERTLSTGEGTMNTTAIARLIDREFEIAQCPEALFDLVAKELLSEQPWLRLRALGILHANCSSPFTWLAHMADTNADEGSIRGSRNSNPPPPPKPSDESSASTTSCVADDLCFNVICEDGVAINAILSAMRNGKYEDLPEQTATSENRDSVSANSENYSSKMLEFYVNKLGLRLRPAPASNTKVGASEEITPNYPNPFSSKASSDSPLSTYHLHRLHMAMFNALCATAGVTISFDSHSVFFGGPASVIPKTDHPLQIVRRVVSPLSPTSVGTITAIMRIVASLFSTVGSLEIWFASQLANQLECAVNTLTGDALPDKATTWAISLLEQYRTSLMCMVAVRSSLHTSSTSRVLDSKQEPSNNLFSSLLRQSRRYSSSLGFLCVGDERGRGLQEWIASGAPAPSDKPGPDTRTGYIPILQFSPLNAGLRIRLLSWNTLQRVQETTSTVPSSSVVSIREFSFELLRSPSFQTILQRISKDNRKTIQRYFPFLNTEWQMIPAVGKEYGLEYSSSISKALEAYARRTSKLGSNGSISGLAYSPTKTRRSLLEALTRASEEEQLRDDLPPLSSLMKLFEQVEDADCIYWANPIAVSSAEQVEKRTLCKWAPRLVNLFTTYRDSSPDFSVCEILRSMIYTADDCSSLIMLMLTSPLPLLTLPEIFETSADPSHEIRSTASVHSENAVNASPIEGLGVGESNDRDDTAASELADNTQDEDATSGRDQFKRKDPSTLYAEVEDPETWSVFANSQPKVEVTRMLSMATVSSDEEFQGKNEEEEVREEPESAHRIHRPNTPPGEWVMFRLAGGSLR